MSWGSDLLGEDDYSDPGPLIHDNQHFAVNTNPMIHSTRKDPQLLSQTSSEAERDCAKGYLRVLVRILLVLEVSVQWFSAIIWTNPNYNVVGNEAAIDLSNTICNILLLCYSWYMSYEALGQVKFEWFESERCADRVFVLLLICFNCGACCLWRDSAERYRQDRSKELCCKCHKPGAAFRKTEITFYRRWVALFVGFAGVPLFHEMLKYIRDTQGPYHINDTIFTWGVAIVLNSFFFGLLVFFASTWLKDDNLRDSQSYISTDGIVVTGPNNVYNTTQDSPSKPKPSIGKDEYVTFGEKPRSFHEKKLQRSFSSSHGSFPEVSPNVQIVVAIPSEEITRGDFIAGGSFGAIFKGTYSGASVALKYINKTSKRHRAELIKEYKTLNQLPYHKNVLQIFGYCDDPENECLVLDYIDGSSLYDMIQQISDGVIPNFDDKVLMSILHQCAVGIEHMHKFNLIHRDIAARNVLCTKMYTITIIDFGLSRFADKGGRTNTAIGPVRWMAPETVLNDEITYSTKSDVWAFGCLIYELLELTVPYPDLMDIQVVMGLQSAELKPTPTKTWENEKVQELCQRCWLANPQNRPEMKEIRTELFPLLLNETQRTPIA